MRPIRSTAIAHVVLSLDPGGTEKLVIEIARRCSREFRTHIYCLDRAGEWAAQLAASGIQVRTAGRRPGFDARLPQRIREFMALDGITVLHCHQYTPFVYGSLAAVFAKDVRLVFTEHGRLSNAAPSRRRRFVNPFLAPLADVIIAVSAELREFMSSEGFRRDRIRVVHNGIDPGPPPTPAARAAARACLGLSDAAMVVGTAARLDTVKNLQVAIEAFETIRATQPRALLVLVGDGPERHALESHPVAQRLGASIQWLGYRRDVRALLPGFDVYVNTSVYEGISVTLLEAMAAGVPVVATSVGGTPEIVVDGLTGLLVESGDPVACAKAVDRMFASADLRRALSTAARERVESHFSFDRMFAQYLRAYALA